MHGRTHRLGLVPLISSLALLFSAVASAPAAAMGASATSARTAAASRGSVLDLLNDERDRRGLEPLSTSAQLARAAQRHANEMAAEDYFAHDSLDGRSFVDRIRSTGYLRDVPGRWRLAENIAWATGTKAVPRAVVRAWMDSPAHRHHILDPDLRQIGFGTREHDGRAVYVTDLGVRGGR